MPAASRRSRHWPADATADFTEHTPRLQTTVGAVAMAHVDVENEDIARRAIAENDADIEGAAVAPKRSFNGRRFARRQVEIAPAAGNAPIPGAPHRFDAKADAPVLQRSAQRFT
jgi:hypothetical protein